MPVEIPPVGSGNGGSSVGVGKSSSSSSVGNGSSSSVGVGSASSVGVGSSSSSSREVVDGTPLGVEAAREEVEDVRAELLLITMDDAGNEGATRLELLLLNIDEAGDEDVLMMGIPLLEAIILDDGCIILVTASRGDKRIAPTLLFPAVTKLSSPCDGGDLK